MAILLKNVAMFRERGGGEAESVFVTNNERGKGEGYTRDNIYRHIFLFIIYIYIYMCVWFMNSFLCLFDYLLFGVRGNRLPCLGNVDFGLKLNDLVFASHLPLIGSFSLPIKPTICSCDSYTPPNTFFIEKKEHFSIQIYHSAVFLIK